MILTTKVLNGEVVKRGEIGETADLLEISNDPLDIVR
jgi:hypothetical protein